MGRRRGVLGGRDEWVCPAAGFQAWRSERRLLGLGAVVLTFTPAEEKATRALPRGSRHGLCQLRETQPARRSARGQMGLVLGQSWKS